MRSPASLGRRGEGCARRRGSNPVPSPSKGTENLTLANRSKCPVFAPCCFIDNKNDFLVELNWGIFNPTGCSVMKAKVNMGARLANSTHALGGSTTIAGTTN